MFIFRVWIGWVAGRLSSEDIFSFVQIALAYVNLMTLDLARLLNQIKNPEPRTCLLFLIHEHKQPLERRTRLAINIIELLSIWLP